MVATARFFNIVKFKEREAGCPGWMGCLFCFPAADATGVVAGGAAGVGARATFALKWGEMAVFISVMGEGNVRILRVQKF